MYRADSGGNKSKMGLGLPTRTIVPWCAAGRKPELQFAGPFGAKPRRSGSTTNVGKLSVSEPRPYEIHAPIAGKPGSTKPVFCMNVARPCTLDFEIIEWMNAMSSAHEPMCGTRSLIHLPHWPRGLHSHGLFISSPGSL